MTSPRRFDQELPAIFAALYPIATPDYRDELVQRIAVTPQRPAWTFIERWLPVEITAQRVAGPRIPMRQFAILALLGLLLAAALAIYVGSQQRLPDAFGLAANGTVAYTIDGDIYLQDTLDGTSRLWVGGPSVDHVVAFSPLGTHLLFVREEGAGHDLWALQADGDEPLRLGGPYLELARMEWSPDESTVAISHFVKSVPAISLVMADGSGENLLDFGMPVDEPTWRPPSGAQIAFRGETEGHWGLFLANADGSNVVRMPVSRDQLEEPFEALAPAWSPDGTRIAYHRLVLTPGEGNGNGFRINVADVDAFGGLTNDRTLTFVATSDDEHHVAWSPDGHLIFARHDDGTDYLSMAAPETGATVTELGVTETGGFDNIGYVVAPDGRTVIAHEFGSGVDWVIDTSSGVATHAAFTSDEGVAFQRIAP